MRQSTSNIRPQPWWGRHSTFQPLFPRSSTQQTCDVRWGARQRAGDLSGTQPPADRATSSVHGRPSDQTRKAGMLKLKLRPDASRFKHNPRAPGGLPQDGWAGPPSLCFLTLPPVKSLLVGGCPALCPQYLPAPSSPLETGLVVHRANTCGWNERQSTWLRWGGRWLAPWGIPQAFCVACISGSRGPRSLGGGPAVGDRLWKAGNQELGFDEGARTHQASKLRHPFSPPSLTHWASPGPAALVSVWNCGGQGRSCRTVMGRRHFRWLLGVSRVGRTRTGWPWEPGPVIDSPHKWWASRSPQDRTGCPRADVSDKGLFNKEPSQLINQTNHI